MLKQTLEEKNNAIKQLSSEKRQIQIEHADNLKTLARELMNIEEKNTKISTGEFFFLLHPKFYKKRIKGRKTKTCKYKRTAQTYKENNRSIRTPS
jgi:hypothetical protein